MLNPIPHSYWVLPGRLLAGAYPGAADETLARKRVRQLLEAGVTFFLDLTEEGELNPYFPLAQEEDGGQTKRMEHHRLPIRDFDVPPAEHMADILDTIDAALEAGHTMYVHCWGGIGRTGTVVGCYLVRQGMSGEEALAEIARLRQHIPAGGRRSPETAAQRQMILEWAALSRETP